MSQRKTNQELQNEIDRLEQELAALRQTVLNLQKQIDDLHKLPKFPPYQPYREPYSEPDDKPYKPWKQPTPPYRISDDDYWKRPIQILSSKFSN